MNGARRAAWTAALAGLALAAAGCGKDELKCPAGQTACGGACVDTASDPNNCRFCGFRCATGATCTPAGCQCPAGQQACGGACVSLGADPNCGACSHACGVLGACSTLTVPASCDCGTYAKCGPAASPECVDVNANDAGNCGGCGHRCGLGTCGSGVCTCTTGTGIADCGTTASPQCVNTLTDPKNCGGCGGTCPACICGAGSSCSVGHCCADGLTWCGAACVDTATDENNCGGCGSSCAGTCSVGHCCPAGLTWCGGPTCVNTLTDPANCGICGHACSASQVCSGTCQCPAPMPLPCGTTCCAGNACCLGNTCQPLHSNGLGQTYYDCAALGTPGTGTTYTAAMAVKAGEAWAPGSSANPAHPCGSGFCNAVQANGQCAVWCYQGMLAGYAHLDDVDVVCVCPLQGERPWN